MSKPTRIDIASGENGWDADVDANFQSIFEGPFPIRKHTGALPGAGLFEDCLVQHNDGPGGTNVLKESDGAQWLARNPPIGTTAIMSAICHSNGKRLQVKEVALGAMPNATTKNVAHGIAGLDLAITDGMIVFGRMSDGTTVHHFPSSRVSVDVNATNIVLASPANESAFTGRLIMLFTT